MTVKNPNSKFKRYVIKRDKYKSNDYASDPSGTGYLAEEVDRHFAKLAEKDKKILNALNAIVSLGDNLSDTAQATETDPNDAVERGNKYAAARFIAAKLLEEISA